MNSCLPLEEKQNKTKQKLARHHFKLCSGHVLIKFELVKMLHSLHCSVVGFIHCADLVLNSGPVLDHLKPTELLHLNFFSHNVIWCPMSLRDKAFIIECDVMKSTWRESAAKLGWIAVKILFSMTFPGSGFVFIGTFSCRKHEARGPRKWCFLCEPF